MRDLARASSQVKDGHETLLGSVEHYLPSLSWEVYYELLSLSLSALGNKNRDISLRLPATLWHAQQ